MHYIQSLVHPFLALAAVAATLALPSCRGPAVVPQPPGSWDHEGLHPIIHEQGQCPICDLYLQAQTYVIRVHGAGGHGAGVVVSAGGLAVTSAHVVLGSDRIEAELHDGRALPGRVLVLDASEDLALLQLDAAGEPWQPATLAAGVPPPIGSEVHVVGHPLGLGWTLSRGIVSGYRTLEGRPMIQTDAAISPGNSGGALLDRQGRLVGIVASKLLGGGAENLAFARPTSVVLDFLSRSGAAP